MKHTKYAKQNVPHEVAEAFSSYYFFINRLHHVSKNPRLHSLSDEIWDWVYNTREEQIKYTGSFATTYSQRIDVRPQMNKLFKLFEHHEDLNVIYDYVFAEHALIDAQVAAEKLAKA